MSPFGTPTRYPAVRERGLTYLQTVRFLKASREEAKMKVEELAHRLDVQPREMRDYEDERKDCPASVFFKWARAFGCRVRFEP